jgi:hypothetical protein
MATKEDAITHMVDASFAAQTEASSAEGGPADEE